MKHCIITHWHHLSFSLKLLLPYLQGFIFNGFISMETTRDISFVGFPINFMYFYIQKSTFICTYICTCDITHSVDSVQEAWLPGSIFFLPQQVLSVKNDRNRSAMNQTYLTIYAHVCMDLCGRTYCICQQYAKKRLNVFLWIVQTHAEMM